MEQRGTVAEANRHEPSNSWPAGDVGTSGRCVNGPLVAQVDQAELFPPVEQ
jgi:hypothetical protein